jgi:glycerol uptake facilitator-like aquaporin
LVTAVVGSGIMATTLSPNDVGLQLLENSVATAFALGALILTFGPVSGATSTRSSPPQTGTSAGAPRPA